MHTKAQAATVGIKHPQLCSIYFKKDWNMTSTSASNFRMQVFCSIQFLPYTIENSYPALILWPELCSEIETYSLIAMEFTGSTNYLDIVIWFSMPNFFKAIPCNYQVLQEVLYYIIFSYFRKNQPR